MWAWVNEKKINGERTIYQRDTINPKLERIIISETKFVEEKDEEGNKTGKIIKTKIENEVKIEKDKKVKDKYKELIGVK